MPSLLALSNGRRDIIVPSCQKIENVPTIRPASKNRKNEAEIIESLSDNGFNSKLIRMPEGKQYTYINQANYIFLIEL